MKKRKIPQGKARDVGVNRLWRFCTAGNAYFVSLIFRPMLTLSSALFVFEICLQINLLLRLKPERGP